jgi:hypothetical protein
MASFITGTGITTGLTPMTVHELEWSGKCFAIPMLTLLQLLQVLDCSDSKDTCVVICYLLGVKLQT